MQDFLYYLSLREFDFYHPLITTNPYRENAEVRETKEFTKAIVANFLENVQMIVGFSKLPDNKMERYILMQNAYFYTLLELLAKYEENPEKPILSSSQTLKSKFINTDTSYQVPQGIFDIENLHKLKAMLYIQSTGQTLSVDLILEELKLETGRWAGVCIVRGKGQRDEKYF